MLRKYNDLKVGQKVHFYGDERNQPGHGEITSRIYTEHGFYLYTIFLHDGRTIKDITPVYFGNRFELQEVVKAANKESLINS